jgi:molybdate transport system ATP-binding protein
LAVRASDISISLHLPTDSSILNYIPATITALTPAQAGRVCVTLLADDVPMYALITQRSAAQLALANGQHVFAGVKAVALA